MFEDLIPAASAQTPAPTPGLFDDLVPTASAQTSTSPPGLFDDLIPAAGASGEAGALVAEPSVSAQPEASLGSVLKQVAIGIPEGIIGMAGAVTDVMNGTFLAHPLINAIAGEKTADAVFPSESKLLHETLPTALNPENYPARNLPERIARGIGEALPGTAIPGGSLASRLLTQTLAGATGAAAAEVVPEPYKPIAQLAGNLIGAGTTSFRSNRAANVDATVKAARPRANALRPEPETSAEPTGPPPDQTSQPQNGAPSGAVSVFEDSQLVRLPNDRLAGRPNRRGNAPLGDDGYPVELHHEGQVQGGTVRELTQYDHRLGENYKKNHTNTGQGPSLIDRLLSRRDRYGHWTQELDRGRFDKLPELSETQVQELRRVTRERVESQRQRSKE